MAHLLINSLSCTRSFADFEYPWCTRSLALCISLELCGLYTSFIQKENVCTVHSIDILFFTFGIPAWLSFQGRSSTVAGFYPNWVSNLNNIYDLFLKKKTMSPILSNYLESDNEQITESSWYYIHSVLLVMPLGHLKSLFHLFHNRHLENLLIVWKL